MTMSSSIWDRSGLEIDRPFLAFSYKTSSNFFHIPFIITIDIIHPNKRSQIFFKNIYTFYCAKTTKTLNGKQIAKTLIDK
jgi:hypothetical protein